MGIRRAALMAVVALCGALAATPAHATFPGANGKIAHIFDDAGNVEILTVNPDGSARTNITNHPARDELPRWSPDGTEIAFVSDRGGNKDIWLMNADGSNPAALTSDAAADSGPVWSPDGTKIAFASNRDADADVELWVMDADGSNESQLTDISFGRSWAPDGSRLALGQSADIYTVSTDGSGLTLLTGEPEHSQDYNPAWSPDGTTIAFQDWRPLCSCGYEVWTMRPDGSQKTLIYQFGEVGSWAPIGRRLLLDEATATMNADGTDVQHPTQNHQPPNFPDTWYGYADAAWSPDARFLTGSRRLCFADPEAGCLSPQIFVLDLAADTVVEIGQGTFPDWQPLPVNAYPRPRAASPIRTSLVPAYRACDAPNRTHGPPLEEPSCSPPVRTPTALLTVGTPDANGEASRSTGRVTINSLPGDPATAADEADVRLRARITDVRLTSDLSDYAGELEAGMTLRITDRLNTPHPGGPGAATVQDLMYGFPVPCTPTADPAIGSDCAVDTTAKTLVPGIVQEKRRAVWELGRVQVLDHAGNVFLRQGVFIP